MPIITLKDGKPLQVAEGRRLVLALEEGGIDILHRCGGQARCTTCRVQFVRGEPTLMTTAERERLELRGLLGEVRLSCQISCDHDMTLLVLNTVSNSDVEDAGPLPADEITPQPEWVAAPPARSAAGE
jgi:ferredoxin